MGSDPARRFAASDITGYGDRADNSAVTGTWNPDGTALLSAFNGLDASGNWTLSCLTRRLGI